MQNLSHEQRAPTFLAAYEALAENIQARGDLFHVSVARQLELLHELSESVMGRFLIEKGGVNGYWTHYAVTHPDLGRKTQCDSQGNPFLPLEAFILDSAPLILATQQRFAHFKACIQQQIVEGVSFASIPSGVMGELLDLDYSSVNTFSLHGIDLDPEAHVLAKSYAEEKGLLSHCDFSEKDAWNLGMSGEFDLIASNGLSMYEPDDEKVVDLYRQFYHALKAGGILVTSFMTPPPSPGVNTEWRLDRINPEHALLQRILFLDVLNVKWQAFRTEKVVREQLLQAGFCEIEIIYDEAHVFPTVVAKKS